MNPRKVIVILELLTVHRYVNLRRSQWWNSVLRYGSATALPPDLLLTV